ncbi:MAG: D-alanine--D-alanine ligase [Planctomycetes bacterium]|nr:D-alanine--D-alanine ligase [Planctomycetota bacterium]
MNTDKPRLLLFRQKKLRIGVLLGGFSSERKVSLKSGRAVVKALKGLGHPVKVIDVRSPNIIKSLKDIDFAFIVLHGKFGEDGTLQRILEKQHIPYTGPRPKASQAAFDKAITKKILTRHKIPTAPYCIMRNAECGMRNYNSEFRIPNSSFLGYPLVVKPCREGSSVGISIAHNDRELKAGLKEAAKYDSTIILEQFIKGREVTVGILGQTPLPLVEVRPKQGFYSFKAKYQDKTTEYIVKPRFPAKVVRKIQQTALRAYRALGCSGLSRVDLIYSKEKGPFVLEINTIPGMTERSLLPKAARAVGIEFPQLCERIVEQTLTTKGTK